MFNELSFADFKQLAQSHKRIVVHKEIPGDEVTPINVFFALEKYMQSPILLESNPKEKELGRYSHLFLDPALEIKAFGKQVTITEGATKQNIETDPFELLRNYQKEYYAESSHPLANFIGGLVD